MNDADEPTGPFDPRQAGQDPDRTQAAPLPAPDPVRRSEPLLPGGHVREAPSGPRRGPRDRQLLAPLAVIVLSVGALAVVFLMTRGGADTERVSAPTAPPSVLTVAPTTADPPQPSDATPQPMPSASTPSTPDAGASTSATEQTDGGSETSTDGENTGSATLPAGLKSCGEGIGVSVSTTCQFAQSVADQVRRDAPESGRFVVNARSETTKKDYALQCNAGPITVCVGGRNAAIYITG